MGSEWQEQLEPGAGVTDILKTLGKALLEPAVIAFLVLAVTIGLWLPLAAYFLLLTWLFGMGPLFMWVVAGIGAVLFFSGMAHFVGWSLRLIPYASEVKAAKRSGRKVRIDLALDAWRIWSKRRRFGPLFMAMLSIFLILPAWIALAVANSAPSKGPGTAPQATRDEQVRALIRRMEKRVFSPPTARRP